MPGTQAARAAERSQQSGLTTAHGVLGTQIGCGNSSRAKVEQLSEESQGAQLDLASCLCPPQGMQVSGGQPEWSSRCRSLHTAAHSGTESGRSLASPHQLQHSICLEEQQHIGQTTLPLLPMRVPAQT